MTDYIVLVVATPEELRNTILLSIPGLLNIGYVANRIKEIYTSKHRCYKFVPNTPIYIQAYSPHEIYVTESAATFEVIEELLVRRRVNRATLHVVSSLDMVE